MEFKHITSQEDLKKVFPVMRELRTHLDEATYLELLKKAKAEADYQLLAAFEGDDCRGLMGYRFITDFVHGYHLYVDDLVVTSSFRSKGLGSDFLSKAKEIAIEKKCTGLRLCTGIENEDGKRFYERNEWNLRAVAYKVRL